MKISFAICTHNEGHYINNLLLKITEFIKYDVPSGIEYEVVVVDDFSTDPYTKSILDKYKDHIRLYQHELNGDFAEHKNFMNGCCTGDWILNLDADEWVADDFMGYMSMIIEANPDIEAYYIPRVNTVDGLTLGHVRKWGWVLTKMEEYKKIKVIDHQSDEYKLLDDFKYIIDDESGVVTYYEPIIMWPDFQMRLYRNDSNIKWKNKVHEQLVGFKRHGVLPQEPTLAIQHFKDIERQEMQNNLYERIQ